MAVTVRSTTSLLIRKGWEELQPFEGRLSMAWQVAAQCMLAALVCMTYGIPLVAIGCYLVLFIMKYDSNESSVMAIGISILVSLVVVAMVPIVRWTIDVPLLRMVVIVLASLLFLYIGIASQLGPAGNIVAMVIAFIMTLLSQVPFGEVATRALLYAWLMVAAPMGVVVLFNLLLGRSSFPLLRRALERRLLAAASVLEGSQPAASVEALLAEGSGELKKHALLMKLFHLAPAVQTRFLQAAIDSSYRLLLAVSKPSLAESDLAEREQLAAQCKALTMCCEPVQSRVQLAPTPVQDVRLQDVQTALTALAAGTPQTPGKGGSKSFFFDDALSNPDYQHYAVRTTAAAVICYLVYTAIDWQDIHTAMITCYVAALGSTAETVHKLFLRIIGCLIGAVMGMGSILFIIPNITSIGSLMVLVFMGILVAGWVAAGSERIAYAGIQIGLAFLLTVLQGFGPEVKMSVAGDRIIGILLGNVVMFLMFTKLWPVSVFTSIGPGLAAALERLSGLMVPTAQEDPAPSDLSEIMADLNRAQESLQLLMFEPQRLHPVESEAIFLKKTIQKAEQMCRLAAFQETRLTPEYRQLALEIPSLIPQVKRVSTGLPST